MRPVLILAVGLLAGCGSSVAPNGAATPVLKTDQVIVAHRGASGHAPEHTLAAYDLALQMGAEYIEQDVYSTSDGVLVCLHDTTLDRTARGPAENCTGNVNSKTLAQLKTCDMGSWFNETYPDRAKPEYVGQKIPTLEEVFQRYGRDVNYYIEIKPGLDLTPPSVAQRLLDLMQQYGLREGSVQRRQVLVQSFIPTVLLEMQRLDPEIPLIQLMQPLTTNAATMALIARYSFGIGPPMSDVSASLVQQAHGLGLAMHPYTVNSTEDLERIAGYCVDGMFTNFPDRYREVLAANKYDCPAPIR
ncbi:glycerophosphodiester phosphodiesterase [Solimonas sp. SE-A11]|uniref:glycerophosphodiester phosphodiesterase n=1 Tax=Solimonas sp. SE-A11 TaxID=3054954 RepID=UPI00259CA4CF|nr:glycerophosphodiester phosphodiesterase [Solimonas sp. SE-A11]MDM4770982.1 glycerophosphodiester phosphodiesterase [Solimonas sp. SE-A11]